MRADELPVLTLAGTPRRCGEGHGEHFRDHIRAFYGGWARSVEKLSGRRIEEVAADFRTSTRLEATMQHWTPALLEELQGIAAAADVPWGPFFMFNSTDEHDWFLKHRNEGVPLPDPRGCSAASVDGLLGQNMDIPGATEGRQIILRIRHDGAEHETMVVSLTGMLALMGMNSAPFGVVNNSLRGLNVRVDGLPVNVMVRAVLAQAHRADAAAFLQRAPHASGQNYILADAGTAVMFECSAGGAVAVRQQGRSLAHTNHPLASSDIQADAAFHGRASSSDTFLRLSALQEQLATGEGFEGLASALRSHQHPDDPVCRHLTDRRTNFSAASVIYEFGPAPAMHVTPGPPCLESYRRIAF